MEIKSKVNGQRAPKLTLGPPICRCRINLPENGVQSIPATMGSAESSGKIHPISTVLRTTEETEPFAYTNTSSTFSSFGRSQIGQWKILEHDLHKHPRSQGSLDVAQNYFLRKLREIQ